MEFSLSRVSEMMVKSVREFCAREVPRIDAYMIEHDGYPPDLMQTYARARMLGLVTPKEYGGVGTTNFNMILLCEEMGRTGSTCFMPLMMNNSVSETINFFGSEDAKKRFIPPLCDGSAWATTAFTEPGTGSDPRAITTSAEADADGFVLNGTKRFISMANKPGYGIYYCKDLSMEGEKKGITAFIVDKSAEGYSCSEHYRMMGLEGSDTCDVYLRNVRVPRGNVLGKPGEGFRILLRWIAGERIQQAAGMVGTAQGALDESVKYCKERTVGKMPLGTMQGFTWMLAEMKAKLEACRLMVQRAAWIQDQGEPFETISAEVKVFTTPTIQEITRMAVQIHGSYGYSKEYKVERLHRLAMHQGVVASSLEINKTIAGMALLKS
ncbi:MAG: acyl-CoA dehydrogenase family protein [Thermodesulfobacteriota bacterium]